MKLTEIFWFLFFFNVAIWVLGILGLSPVEWSPVSPESLGFIGAGAVALAFFGVAAISLIPGVKPSVNTIVFGAFATAVGAGIGLTTSILKMVFSIVPYGYMYLTLITAAIGIASVFGLVQLATGGWRGYE